MTNLSHGVQNLAANDILTVTDDYVFLELEPHYNSVLLTSYSGGPGFKSRP
jgi:hypothetical protein